MCLHWAAKHEQDTKEKTEKVPRQQTTSKQKHGETERDRKEKKNGLQGNNSIYERLNDKPGPEPDEEPQSSTHQKWIKRKIHLLMLLFLQDDISLYWGHRETKRSFGFHTFCSLKAQPWLLTPIFCCTHHNKDSWKMRMWSLLQKFQNKM